MAAGFVQSCRVDVFVEGAFSWLAVAMNRRGASPRRPVAEMYLRPPCGIYGLGQEHDQWRRDYLQGEVGQMTGSAVPRTKQSSPPAHCLFRRPTPVLPVLSLERKGRSRLPL